MFYTLWALLGCTTEEVFIIYGLGYKLNRVSKGLTWGGGGMKVLTHLLGLEGGWVNKFEFVLQVTELRYKENHGNMY